MKEIDEVIRVAISYGESIKERLNYAYLAFFFRSIGIYVCAIDELHHTSNDLLDNMLIIHVDKTISDNEIIFDEKKRIYIDVLLDEIEGYDKSLILLRNSPDVQRLFLGKLISAINMRDYVNDILIDVYIRYKIAFHSLNMQYYANKRSQAVSNAEDAFETAYYYLKNNKKNVVNKTYNFRYARLWYAQKANEGCKYMLWIPQFSINKMKDKCLNLIRRYPMRSSAKLLLGLFYRYEFGYANASNDCFKIVLKEEKQYSYSDQIYYWIGKNYEDYYQNKCMAEKYYLTSFEKNKSFKSLYKIAIITRDKGNIDEYKKAIDYFNDIITGFDFKKKYSLMCPMEVEYLFKAYFQIAYISGVRLKYGQGDVIRAGVEAVNIRDHIDQFKDFYQILYGDQCEYYLELSKDRMAVKGLYKMISHSYDDIKEPESANKFWKKYSESV